MTSREGRTRRREEERRQAKLAYKAEKLAGTPISAPRFNPELEDEFPRELQAEANVIRDRVHRTVGLTPAADPQERAEINRLNSLHSTGPRTHDGKLASSRNSLKHGLCSGAVIIPGEDPAAFEALMHDLLEEHQPANTTEELLVNEMAQSYWLTQRALRLQNECFTENGIDEKRLSLFLRYQTTHDRAFHKALNTLVKLQNRARGCPLGQAVSAPGFVSQRPPQPLNEPGFVSQNPIETPLAGQFVWQNCRSEAA